MIKEATAKLILKQDLTYDETVACMDEIMTGQTSQVQTAGFLTALETKGETIEEITASAVTMRSHALKVEHDMDVLEIVGTGGDNAGSFNISTTAGFVIAAGGVKVAKHGNRAASSKSGAADCLEALGVDVNQEPANCVKTLQDLNYCFFFAQKYHTSMKYVGPVRKELGVRTIFNILGPLTNPGHNTMQVLGVYDESLLEPMSRVLYNLGVKRSVALYGTSKLDELSTCCDTLVCENHNGVFNRYTIKPEDFGFDRCDISDLEGGTSAENAAITLAILSGEKGPKRDTVLLNAGAGLYIGGVTKDIAEGVKLAAQLIDSGAAKEKLLAYIEASKQV